MVTGPGIIGLVSGRDIMALVMGRDTMATVGWTFINTRGDPNLRLY